ncbi:MAG: HlyD family secretion protein [Candidatus Saccharibacteria bacterium]
MSIAKRVVMMAVVLLLVTSGYWAYQKYFSDNGGQIKASGTIEATEADVSAKTPGALKGVYVSEGDTVKKGQQIAEITRNDLVAQREQAAMALLRAQAQLDDLISGARAQEVEQAAANVNIARASYDKSSEDLAREQGLYDQGAVSKNELERFQMAAELDKNKLQAAQAQLKLLQSGSRPQAIVAAKAEVDRSKAVLKAADAQLADLKMCSPIDGVVLTKNFETGEFVQMGSPVVTISDLNDMWIKVYIPTDDKPSIKLGQKVHFTVSGSDQKFVGRISWISSKGEFTPKMIQTEKERANVVFAVKIKIDDHDGILKPGMPADVVF